MFDKLKKIKELKELQGQLGQERECVEKDGVRVVMNGKMQIEEIKLNLELSQEKQEEVLAQCLNEAVKKIQMNLFQKMSGGGFGI